MEFLAQNLDLIILCLSGLLVLSIFYLISSLTISIQANKAYSPVGQSIETLQEANKVKVQLEDKYLGLQRDYKQALESIDPLEKALRDADLGVGTNDSHFYVSEIGEKAIPLLEASLEQVRHALKVMVSNKTACICSWDLNKVRVNNKKSETTKFFNREIKLRIRCLDNEFKMAQAIVDWNNINRLIDRCKDTFDQINQRGDLVKTKLQKKYLDLKISELTLIYEINQAKQREKEDAQAENARIREAEREEERIRKAAEKAKKDRELMEMLVQKELEKLDAASAEQVKHLEALKEQLADLKQKEHRAVSMAQITRAGYIYVITNIDSFGEGICKVGMTRRVNPLDRVRELGDASVPSLFDVEYLAYTEDAPKLERYLHSRLEDKRVNLVNRRKEFFVAKPKEVISLLGEFEGEFEAVELVDK